MLLTVACVGKKVLTYLGMRLLCLMCVALHEVLIEWSTRDQVKSE